MRTFLSKYWVLILIVFAKFILQYALVNPYYELHRDEFLHLDQSDHISFGFISLPPFTSIISKLIFLLGGGEFWVKFFPALAGALTIVTAWLITEELGGGIRAKLLVSLALLFSVLTRLNMLFQPNSVDILAWTLIFLALIRYFRRSDPKQLIYLAVFAAIGFYNKYNVVFLLTGIAAGIFLTSQRKILKQRHFWIAVLILAVLLIPNIIWQVRHDFPVIDHMRILKENQLDNNSGSGFLLSQIKIFFGSLPLIVIGITALLLYKPFRPYRFVAIAFITVLALFSVFRAKDYYALGIYPVIFAFAGIYLDKALGYRTATALISFLVIFNLALFAALARYVMPAMPPEQIIRNSKTFEKFGMLRWEDGKNHSLPQDFSDMTGWKEMADKALEAYRMIPEEEHAGTLVFCDNYGQTGALNYYNRGKMKEAYSFNTDYIYWLERIPYIKNVILVGEMTEDSIAKMFTEYRQTGVVENQYAREKGTGIFLFTGADPAFTEFFYNEAERRKRELDIF